LKVKWLQILQCNGRTPKKKLQWYFRHPMRPIPNLTTCPTSPAAREPISVAIPFDLLRKRGAVMQMANVGHGEKRRSSWEGKGLPFVQH
jgi:hypothetical protein